jgi:hypothetical protein
MKTERSPLGNPYYQLAYNGERGKSVALYRSWLWKKIKEDDSAVMQALREIAAAERSGRLVKLECVCAPKICHGDIIKKAVEWFIKKGG